jgi:hypothetical protein
VKPFFTDEDFMIYSEDVIGSPCLAAKIANDKLEREGKVVWKDEEVYPDGRWWELELVDEDKYATHRALLVNIEPPRGDEGAEG